MGVIMQLVALVVESIRVTLVQILLQGTEIKFDPITTLYYVAPSCFLFLISSWCYFEARSLLADPDIQVTPLILVTNAACAFGVALSLKRVTQCPRLRILSMLQEGVASGFALCRQVAKLPVPFMSIIHEHQHIRTHMHISRSRYDRLAPQSRFEPG